MLHPRVYQPRLSDRLDDAARDLAARLTSGVIRCTDADQTTDLRALSLMLAEWADEARHIEGQAVAHIREQGGALAPRRAGRVA